MKSFSLLALFITCAFQNAVGQVDNLMIKSSDKGLYFDHKVTPKENFYSVGRLYNVPPKEIASFNDLDMERGLSLDQTLHIPLLGTNFSQSVNEGTPVYYQVGKKEGLMKVSRSSNNVSLKKLRNWNSLSGNYINAGDKLVVGFLIGGQLPLVKIKEPVTTNQEDKPVVVNTTGAEKNKTVVVPIKEPVVEQKEPETNENKLASPKAHLNTVVIEQAKTGGNDGYFKSFFEQQAKRLPVDKDQTVTSGIFKTASGWKDYKYYMLIDSVKPGTIIKVINPFNDKSVYAKVLGEMNGIRQNVGYDVRISNAAASALDISDTEKFIVKLSY